MRPRVPVSTLRAVWRRWNALDPRLLDGTLALTLAGAAVAQVLLSGSPRWTVVPVAGTALPLAWRRRRPVAAFLVQFVCALASAQPPTWAGILALFVGLYSVSVHSPSRRRSLAVVLLSSVALLIAPLPYALITRMPYQRWDAVVPAPAFQLMLGLTLWLVAGAIRQLQERNRQLERERELATRVALADERARIAHELHDVVAHSVSVMVVQAGAGRRLGATQPDRAAEAMRSVEGAGREALSELRRLLELLTDDAGEITLTPQPGLSQLDTLVERVGTAGLQVQLRREGSPRPLPAGLDLTAYRIIQEALTNALRYAKGAPTEVLVQFLESELRLEVSNGNGRVAPAADGSGRGLLGMEQRVAVYGGRFEAGDRPGGGFAVRASLPLLPIQ